MLTRDMQQYTKMLLLVLLVFLFAAPAQIDATVVDATGFASVGPDSGGYVGVLGFHAAVLNFVSTEDFNKGWFLEGNIFKCGWLFDSHLNTSCSRQGNTSSNVFLNCDTGSTVTCLSLSHGARSSSFAALVNTLGVSDSHSSSCSSSPVCVGGGGGGGCPDPPEEHPGTPKTWTLQGPESTEKKPLILAIHGQGAVAKNDLVLLYDDGFDGNSTHRLAFASMGSPDALEPTRVYSTRNLPAVFEAQYGSVETILASDSDDDEALREFFQISGSYAVIKLRNGWQIGLVDQLHQEDWYVDLKQYQGRYRHGTGEIVSFSTDLGGPVMLNLATVFVRSGESWVTDPLQVLDALSGVFVPTPAQWAQLRAALR